MNQLHRKRSFRPPCRSRHSSSRPAPALSRRGLGHGPNTAAPANAPACVRSPCIYMMNLCWAVSRAPCRDFGDLLGPWQRLPRRRTGGAEASIPCPQEGASPPEQVSKQPQAPKTEPRRQAPKKQNAQKRGSSRKRAETL